MTDYIVLSIILVGAAIAGWWLKRAAVQERERLRAIRETELSAEYDRTVAAVREALLGAGYPATGADSDHDAAVVPGSAKGDQ